MKKLVKTLSISALALSTASSLLTAQAEEEHVLRVASHLPPMTDIVELAAKNIAEPYSIELVEVSDNIQYNEAVFHDEAYASFAQHQPFMAMFNEERDADLEAIQTIYNAVVGFYSPVYQSIEDIEDGAEVAIPSDPTNEARALLILAQQGLITLEEKDALPTVDDIKENPKNLQFTSVDLLNLTGAYEDGVELVFNYPTYIAKIDLTPEDALFLEDEEDNTFAITLVVRKENVDNEATKALKDAFTSPEVYEYLEKLAEAGHLRPAFELESDETTAE